MEEEHWVDRVLLKFGSKKSLQIKIKKGDWGFSEEGNWRRELIKAKHFREAHSSRAQPRTEW